MSVTIVDYGLGNVKAIANVYKRLGVPCVITGNTDELKNTEKIILPGVGAFDFAMERLRQSGMKEKICELAIQRKIPVLGICVGMQMLADSSEEGDLPGLGWIKGRVLKFDRSKMPAGSILPHMGWNNVKLRSENRLFDWLNGDSRFYFLHSYYFVCENRANVIAETNYGIEFASGINSNNIYGVQFHPEKSHHCGVLLLKNFADL